MLNDPLVGCATVVVAYTVTSITREGGKGDPCLQEGKGDEEVNCVNGLVDGEENLQDVDLWASTGFSGYCIVFFYPCTRRIRIRRSHNSVQLYGPMSQRNTGTSEMRCLNALSLKKALCNHIYTRTRYPPLKKTKPPRQSSS